MGSELEPRTGEGDPLGHEEAALDLLVAAIAAEPACRRNHAVARHVGPPARSHDVADGARRPGLPRDLRDVPVGGDSSAGNLTYCGKDPAHKGSRGSGHGLTVAAVVDLAAGTALVSA